MKKFIQLLLVSAAIMLSAAVGAAATSVSTEVFSPGWSAQGGGSCTAEATAIFGQTGTPTHRIFNFVETAGTNRALMQWKNDKVTAALGNQVDYIVFESSFAPTDAVTSVNLMTDGTKTIASMTKDRGGWINGRWNNLRVIYSISDRKTQFYMNGVLKYTCTAAMTFANNDYRLAYIGTNANTPNAVYVYESKLYGVKGDNPGANTGAQLTDTLYTGNLGGTKAMLAPGTTLNSLTEANAVTEGAAVRAYPNGVFDGEWVGNSAALKTGDVIVLQKNGLLTYYDVISDDKLSVFDADNQPEWGLNAANIISKGTLTNYGGKTDGDTCEQYEINAGKTAASITCDYPLDYHYRYVTVKFNAYVNDPAVIKAVSTTTGGGTASLYIKGVNIRKNMWMNFMAVYDTKTGQCKTYFNGTQYSGFLTPGGDGKQFLTDTAKKQLRITMQEVSADGETRTFAIDDFEMFTTPEEPIMDNNFKSIKSAVNVNGSVLYCKQGTTAADIKSDYAVDDAQTVIYNASTGAADDGEITEDSRLAVVTDGGKTIKTYVIVPMSANKIAAYGNGTDGTATAEGEVTAFSFADDNTVLISAQYQDGILKNVSFAKAEDGIASNTIETTGASGEGIKFMVWNDMNECLPLGNVISYTSLSQAE